MQPESHPKRAHLPHNVVVLSWVSFFQDAASEMLYPVLPLFLTGVLGAPVAAVGLIEGVAEATASAMKIVSGRLADLRRRRPMIAGGYALSSIAKPMIGLAQAWPFVLVGRFVDRTGKGIRTSPRDALIADETPSHLRGRAFGFHRAADTAGAVVGPLIGLAMYEMLDHNIRPLFFIAFIPAAISVFLVAFVHEAPHRPVPHAESKITGGPLPTRYWRVVLFLTLFGVVNFSDALLILRAKALGLGFAAVILVVRALQPDLRRPFVSGRSCLRSRAASLRVRDRARDLRGRVPRPRHHHDLGVGVAPLRALRRLHRAHRRRRQSMGRRSASRRP